MNAFALRSPNPSHSVPFSEKIWGASFNPNHRYLKLEQKGPHGNRGVIYQYYVRYTTRKGLLSRLYLLLFNFFFKILRPSSFGFEGRVLPSFPTFLPACVRVRACVRPKTKGPYQSAPGARREGSPQADLFRRPSYYLFQKLQFVSSLSMGMLGRVVLSKLLCCSVWDRYRIYWLLIWSCGETFCNGGRSKIQNLNFLLIRQSSFLRSRAVKVKREQNAQH